MSEIASLSEETFSDAIRADKPVLVDFWAEWCGPCKIIGPMLEELAEEQDSFNIAKLNVDLSPQVAADHDVRSIPTLILFQDGVEKRRVVGAAPKQKLLNDLVDFV